MAATELMRLEPVSLAARANPVMQVAPLSSVPLRAVSPSPQSVPVIFAGRAASPCHAVQLSPRRRAASPHRSPYQVGIPLQFGGHAACCSQHPATFLASAPSASSLAQAALAASSVAAMSLQASKAGFITSPLGTSVPLGRAASPRAASGPSLVGSQAALHHPRFGSARELGQDINQSSPRMDHRQLNGAQPLLIASSGSSLSPLLSPRLYSPGPGSVLTGSHIMTASGRSASPLPGPTPATPWTACPGRIQESHQQEDSLAQQVKALQQAKSQAAAQQAQSEQTIALRQDQLRRETYKAMYASGLAEALKRWPSPVVEDETVPPLSQSLKVDDAQIQPEVSSMGQDGLLGHGSCSASRAEETQASSGLAEPCENLIGASGENMLQEPEATPFPDEELPGESSSVHPELDQADVVANPLEAGSRPVAEEGCSAEPQLPPPAQERAMPKTGSARGNDSPAAAKQPLEATVGKASDSGPSHPGDPAVQTASTNSSSRLGVSARSASSRPSSPSTANRSGRRASVPPSPVLPAHLMQDELNQCLEALQRVADKIPISTLREMRTLKRPPLGVSKILEAIGLVLGEKDLKPGSFRKLLADNLPTRLSRMDPSAITTVQGSKLRPLLDCAEVRQEMISKTCSPACVLAEWCEYISIYLAKTHPSWGAGRLGDRISEAAGMGHPNGGEDASLAGQVGRLEQRSGKNTSQSLEAEVPATGSFMRQETLIVEPDLSSLSQEELRAVRDLKVTKPQVGSVVFHGVTDCTNLDVMSNVVLKRGYVLVYPDPRKKPPVGQGLNKRATVTMYQCFPPGERVSDNEAIEDYKSKIKTMTEENSACRFIDYDCQTGIWKFEVERF
eukprot:TRINITY_DN77678_c0_g1_i1.p1 TRINITY_DN77678_c0_g1~~TRINITY_DN77678_c0_g1_i1.p1  ORF type:complete len:862 (-),score=148.68 TRINITY_DN77678_c0_g1_i1:30-2582(-)